MYDARAQAAIHRMAVSRAAIEARASGRLAELAERYADLERERAVLQITGGGAQPVGSGARPFAPVCIGWRRRVTGRC